MPSRAHRAIIAAAIIPALLSALLVGCGAGGPSPVTSETPSSTPTLPQSTTAPTPVPTQTTEPSSTPEPSATQEDAIPVCSFETLSEFPHDADAYTQGLAFHEGRLFESTGLEGESTLREVDLQTGEVLREVELDDEYFGEGMTILDDRVYQLTWQSGIGLVYDVETFSPVDDWTYTGEGWGLTSDGTNLIMSDGSTLLRVLNPLTFEVLRVVDVTADGEPVELLNELEYVDGEIWANIYVSDRIARIDPVSGAVTSWVDLAGLLPADLREPTTGVLNGIAYDEGSKRLFVTGKLWPRLYEVRPAACD